MPPPDDTWVTLEKTHIEFANKIARMRRKNAVDNDWQPGNGAPDDREIAMAMDVLGARAEAAGKLYLNPVKWHAFSLRADSPDLEDWIDVKGISESYHRLIIQPKKPEQWAYLLVDASQHPRYEIVGWCWGYEGKKQKYWDDPVGQRGGYFIDRNDPIMKPPKELFNEVRMRQAVKAADSELPMLNRQPHEPFVHYCRCGEWGPYGFDVSLRTGRPGTWYCGKHLPK